MDRNTAATIQFAPYYQDDAVTLYNADCRQVLPFLERHDLLLTDPPYGIALSNHDKSGITRSQTSWYIEGDNSQEFGQAIIDAIGGPSVVFASPMKPWKGAWRQHLVWEKGEHVGGGGDPSKCWKQNWELVQVKDTPSLSGRRDGAVLRFQADKELYRLHPSPKPVQLIQYIISKLESCHTILDPFAGSGTTGVAAKLEGRKATLIEISERYCEIAAKRLSQGVLF